MKKFAALLISIAALCWSSVAMAAYQVPRRLNDTIYPSFMAYRVEYMPSVVTIIQVGDGAWSITVDRNPFAHAGSSQVAMCLNFDSATDPRASYFDNDQLHAGSFTRSGGGYTARFTLPEEARLYGCDRFAFCELTVLSSSKDSSCWLKTSYGLGQNAGGTIDFSVDEELHNYETVYKNGAWANTITEYVDERRIYYHYVNGALSTMEAMFDYTVNGVPEAIGFHYKPDGAFLYVTFQDKQTNRTYYYENDGKGWYYYSGNAKSYTSRPQRAPDPARVPGFSIAPSINGSETAAPFYPEEITLNNPLGKLAIYRNGEIVNYTGFAPFEGADFYFRRGVVWDELAGVKQVEGKWYAFDHGRLMREEMLVPFEGGVFAFRNGTIDESVGGLVTFNGEWFVFAYGMFQPSANGAWQNPNDGQWYYMVNGQWVKHTGLVPFNGALFYFMDGKLATGFTGVVRDANGVERQVVNGQVL